MIALTVPEIARLLSGPHRQASPGTGWTGDDATRPSPAGTTTEPDLPVRWRSP